MKNMQTKTNYNYWTLTTWHFCYQCNQYAIYAGSLWSSVGKQPQQKANIKVKHTHWCCVLRPSRLMSWIYNGFMFIFMLYISNYVFTSNLTCFMANHQPIQYLEDTCKAESNNTRIMPGEHCVPKIIRTNSNEHVNKRNTLEWVWLVFGYFFFIVFWNNNL